MCCTAADSHLKILDRVVKSENFSAGGFVKEGDTVLTTETAQRTAGDTVLTTETAQRTLSKIKSEQLFEHFNSLSVTSASNTHA